MKMVMNFVDWNEGRELLASSLSVEFDVVCYFMIAIVVRLPK